MLPSAPAGPCGEASFVPDFGQLVQDFFFLVTPGFQLLHACSCHGIFRADFCYNSTTAWCTASRREYSPHAINVMQWWYRATQLCTAQGWGADMTAHECQPDTRWWLWWYKQGNAVTVVVVAVQTGQDSHCCCGGGTVSEGKTVTVAHVAVGLCGGARCAGSGAPGGP